MTTFYRLRPEVAGGLGRRTVLEQGSTYPRIVQLHYEIEGWFGDDLLTSYPAYVVTKTMGLRLKELGLTGAALREVEITKGDAFIHFHPEVELPEFCWLEVTGLPGVDDFGLDERAHLIVSERAYACLHTGTMRHCRVSLYEPPDAKPVQQEMRFT